MTKEAEQNVAETPWEDLRAGALKGYEEASAAAHSWHSVIPRAINYYFDHARSASKEAEVAGELPDAEATAYELISVLDSMLPRGAMDGSVKRIREEIQRRIERELELARAARPADEPCAECGLDVNRSPSQYCYICYEAQRDQIEELKRQLSERPEWQAVAERAAEKIHHMTDDTMARHMSDAYKKEVAAIILAELLPKEDREER